MANNEKFVPEIRFKGFANAWEQRKLGDTLKNIKSGLSRMLSADDIGLPVVRANNINDGNLDMNRDVKYWYVDDPQGANTVNYHVCAGDILINFINSETKMGTTAIVEAEPLRDTIYTTNILKAQTNDKNDSYFWFALTQTDKYKTDIKIITKPAVNQASFTTVDFKALEYLFPHLEEQTAIGNFFRTLDDTITLYKRKLDRLKKLKNGYLQQMFPQTGESVPRVRFAGFSGEWEQRKLGEVAELSFGGGTPSTANNEFWNGDIPWLQSSDLTEHDVARVNLRKYITQKGLESSAAKLIPAKSIAIVTRVGVGKLGLIPFQYTTSQDFLSLSKLNVDIWFGIYAIYIKLQKEINSVQGTSIKGITKEALLNKTINIPLHISEQVTIGNFFQNLDELITAQSQKLEQIKQLKASYLQKMFV